MDNWPRFDLTIDQSNQWDRLFAQAFQVEQVNESRYIPIPNWVSPTFSKRLILVGSLNPSAPPRWFTGAYCSVEVQVNQGTQTALPPWAVLEIHPIPLRKFKWIMLPDIPNAQFRLSFAFPVWHRQIFLEAWWYNDTVSTDVQQALQNIQAGIDLLL